MKLQHHSTVSSYGQNTQRSTFLQILKDVFEAPVANKVHVNLMQQRILQYWKTIFKQWWTTTTDPLWTRMQRYPLVPCLRLYL